MMNTLQTDIRRLTDALSGIRTPAAPGEYDLHAEVALALQGAGISCEHEYRLAPRCRIDFLSGRIGIEVKKGRPAPADLRKQLTRYLESDVLDAVIVVVQHAVTLPNAIGGKPVVQLSLNRLWGIALP